MGRREGKGFRVLLVCFAAVALGAASHPPALAQEEDPLPVSTKFRGNRSSSDRTLRGVISEAMEGYETEGRPEAMLDDATFFLARYYRSRGFPDAEAEFRVETEPTRVVVIFRINEGRRYRIGTVRFRGNESVSPDTLDDFLPVDSFLDDRFFVRETVERDVRTMRDFYVSEGFVDAKITYTVERDEKREEVVITVLVDEGVRLLLREIRIEGNREVPTRMITEAVEDLLDGPYHPAIEAEVRSRILSVLANEGHPRAKVQVKGIEDRAVGAGRLEVSIDEGPRFRIGRIRVEGNDRTRAGTVRNAMRLRPGDLYRQEAIWRSETELYEPGFFSSVSILEDDRIEDGEAFIDLEVNVVERDPVEFEVYGGYGSYEKIRGGFTTRFLNLFGGWRQVEVSLAGSTVGARGEIRYIDPWLLGERLKTDIAAFLDYREYPSYTLHRRGVRFGVEVPLLDRLRFVETYQYNRSRVTDISPALEEEDVGPVDVSSLRSSLSLDLRDDPIDPTEGGVLSLSYEWANQALGSSIDFHRMQFDSRGYLTLGWDFVGAARFSAGMIVPYGQTDSIPIQERFFNGGADSVRSFKEFELGPQVNGDPVGGEATTTLGVELRHPIWRFIHGAVFWDAGNVMEKSSDWGFRDLRQGIGAGLRASTPVGPIRLDFAVNPDRDPGEDTWNVHLSVGYPF